MKNMKRILLSAMALIAAVALQAQVIETDVTSSVTNPDFENGTTGWTNNGMQTQSNAEFKMKGNTNYCERWVAGPNKLPDSSISQTISVENGTYCITAVAGAIQQGDGSIAIEGVNVIANDQSVAITQAPGIGQFCRLVTEVKNGSLTIAFEVKSTTANWVAFDDVHVYYYGTATIDEAKAFILQKDMYALVEEADEYLGEPMQKAVKDAFLANASKIDSATDLAAAQALLDEMTAQLAEIKACVDVYGRILALIDAAKGDYADWKTDADKLQATKDDPRKTRFGDFLRRSSIDELPQFINVFMGDMSIIGPRPHMELHTEMYNKLVDEYMVRHMVKPGLTGWAQVNGCRGETKEVSQMAARVQNDIWYIENWSMLIDIKI